MQTPAPRPLAYFTDVPRELVRYLGRLLAGAALSPRGLAWCPRVDLLYRLVWCSSGSARRKS
jgi:hypothetical protein